MQASTYSGTTVQPIEKAESSKPSPLRPHFSENFLVRQPLRPAQAITREAQGTKTPGVITGSYVVEAQSGMRPRSEPLTEEPGPTALTVDPDKVVRDTTDRALGSWVRESPGPSEGALNIEPMLAPKIPGDPSGGLVVEAHPLPTIPLFPPHAWPPQGLPA